MSTLTTYEQLRFELNKWMDYVGTNEFLNLPAKKRRKYLQQLKKLVVQVQA